MSSACKTQPPDTLYFFEAIVNAIEEAEVVKGILHLHREMG
jgi:hypothetical protein